MMREYWPGLCCSTGTHRHTVTAYHLLRNSLDSLSKTLSLHTTGPLQQNGSVVLRKQISRPRPTWRMWNTVIINMHMLSQTLALALVWLYRIP